MNAAVYFQIGSQSSVRDHFTDHRYLIQAFRDQLLSAETGLHGHDQYHIHQFQIRLHGLCRGGGFDGDANLFAGGTYFINASLHIFCGFQMKIHQIRTAGSELFHIALRLLDHQMHIQEHVCVGSHCLQDRHSVRD